MRNKYFYAHYNSLAFYLLLVNLNLRLVVVYFSFNAPLAVFISGATFAQIRLKIKINVKKEKVGTLARGLA